MLKKRYTFSSHLFIVFSYFSFWHHCIKKVASTHNFYTRKAVSRNKSNFTRVNSNSSIQTVRFLVPIHQDTLYVGSPVQNLSAYLGIWQYAVVAVVLEAPAADFQFHRQFLVRIIAFPVQRRFIVVAYFLHPF